MLKKIPKIVSPELLKTLAEMGHGDEIVIADGNFPRRNVRQTRDKSRRNKRRGNARRGVDAVAAGHLFRPEFYFNEIDGMRRGQSQPDYMERV